MLRHCPEPFWRHPAHPLDSTSACSSTVRVAFSCLSGGYPCFRRIRLTSRRRLARTFSRSVQSILTLFRTVLNQLTRDLPQRLVPQHLHGAVVRLERIVEGQLVLGEPQLLPTLIRLAHLTGKLNQLLDHLCGLDGPVRVTADGLLQHLGK